jgi:ketosteroid isomerase-like protein
VNGIELTREFWSLWRRDRLPELVARYDEFFADDLEWHSPIVRISGTVLYGRAEFERHVEDLRDSFDEIDATLSEATEIAPDVVLSRVRIHGRGSRSGAVIDALLIGLVRIRDGRIVWAWGSFDLDAGERMASALASGEPAEAGP